MPSDGIPNEEHHRDPLLRPATASTGLHKIAPFDAPQEAPQEAPEEISERLFTKGKCKPQKPRLDKSPVPRLAIRGGSVGTKNGKLRGTKKPRK